MQNQSLTKTDSRGFTLIELLVVITIIGILAGIVLASLTSARSKGKDAARISEIRQIQYALELYYGTYGTYPCKLYNDVNVTCELANTTAMQNPPKDPSGNDYSYAAIGSGTSCTSYHLGISLEATTQQVLRGDKDAAAVAAGSLCTNSLADFSGLSAAAGGSSCNTTAGTAQPSGTETCYDVTP